MSNYHDYDDLFASYERRSNANKEEHHSNAPESPFFPTSFIAISFLFGQSINRSIIPHSFSRFSGDSFRKWSII